jgi:cell wall-associated NlpC family hydrolase
MPSDAASRIASARALIGTPFRLQGRDRDGLDCIGLIAVVHGLETLAPRTYALRGTPADLAMEMLDRHFVRRSAAIPQVADIVLLRPGMDQLHLGLWTGTGLVHAHAGLRRVVETPGPPAFPLLGIWYQETD